MPAGNVARKSRSITSEQSMSRIVAWWSAGVTSAVAAALALRTMDADEKVIAYCASVEADEHPDNARFLADCERWYGQPIMRLYANGYKGVEDVWEQRQYVPYFATPSG